MKRSFPFENIKMKANLFYNKFRVLLLLVKKANTITDFFVLFPFITKIKYT